MTRINISSADVRLLSQTLRAIADDYDLIAEKIDSEGLSTIAARGTSTFEHHVAKIEGNVNSMQKTLQDAIRDQRKMALKNSTQVSTSTNKTLPKIAGTQAASELPGRDDKDDQDDQTVEAAKHRALAAKAAKEAKPKTNRKRKQG